MLAVLDAFSEVLPPTRTYARRSFVWIPVDPKRPEPDGRLGNLSIKVQPSKAGVGRLVECDTYFVERDTPMAGDEGGVAFWLMNVTDPDSEEPYRCVIGGLLPSRCTCTAGRCRVPGEPNITDGCKHRDSVTYLLDNGIIEGGGPTQHRI